MTIEEKRKLYKCGDGYVVLDNVPSWEEYMKDNGDKLLKKSKLLVENSETGNFGFYIDIVNNGSDDNSHAVCCISSFTL